MQPKSHAGDLDYRLRTEYSAVGVWYQLNANTSTGKHAYVGTTPSGLMVLRKVSFPNMLAGLNHWEAGQLARNEEASYLVGKTMGVDDLLLPSVSTRTTIAEYGPALVHVSYRVWDDDATEATSVDDLDERDGTRALAFDLVTMNKDRHIRNIFVRADGKILLIDNANTFYPWPQFEWRKALHARFANATLPDDLLEGLHVVVECLPDRVFELLPEGDAIGKMRQRARTLLEAGRIVPVNEA